MISETNEKYPTPYTTITLHNKYGVYTITVYQDDLTVYDMMEQLIDPVLLAAGFHPNSINDAHSEYANDK